MTQPNTDGRATMQRIVSLLGNRKISLAEFARRMGVEPAHVSNWRRRGIPTNRLARAADVLKVSVDELLGRVDEMPEGAHPVLLTGHIPVIGKVKLSDDGNFSQVAHYETPEGTLAIPSNDPTAYALRCEGSSMMPRIQPGEFVIAEPAQKAEPGDEVIVQNATGDVMIKRFLYSRDGSLYLGSINEAHGTVILPESEVKAVHPILAIIPKKLWHP